MSRHRKYQRSRPHRQSAACSCSPTPTPQCPDEWPDAATVGAAVDLDALASQLLERLSADDVFELMQRIPPKFRQLMLRNIGLLTVSSINRGMAGQVLARIRRDAHPSRSNLLSMLTSPVITLLESDLTIEEWAAVTGDDDARAAAVLAEHESLAYLLHHTVQMTPALRSAGLVSAVAARATASAVALTLLAVDDDLCASTHSALSVEYPRLPTVPRRALEELSPVSRLRRVLPAEALAQTDLDDFDQVMTALEDYAEPQAPSAEPSQNDSHPPHDSAADGGGESEWLLTATTDPDSRAAARTQVLADIAGVLDRWEDVAHDAESILAAVRSGRLWDDAALASLTHLEQAVRTASERAGTLLGAPVEPTSQSLRAAAEDLRYEAHRSQEWLRALTELEAPDAVADAADAARQLARHVLEMSPTAMTDSDHSTIDGLRALHTIVISGMLGSAGHDVDYNELAISDHTVRSTLPSLVSLLLPSGHGAVTVPIDEIHMITAGTESTLDTDTDADTLVPDVESVPGATDLGAASDTGPGRDENQSTSTEDAGPGDELVDGSDSIETRSTAEPQAARTDENADDSAVVLDENEPADDDNAFAQLLSDGARTLSALTGARRRPTPPVAPTRAAGAADPGSHSEAADPPAHPRSLAETAKAADQSTDSDDNGQATQHHQAVLLVPQLLRARRFGLAADLLEACGWPRASVAARRLVAYSTALRHPTGELASAFARASTAISREELSDDRAGQILAWAAAARISVLSPSAGPATVLLNLAPTVASSEALSEVGQALVEASRSGIVVLPETADAVGSVAAQESLATSLAADASEMLVTANTRLIKYIPANGVFQSWMSSGGPLGTLLGAVARNNPASTAEIRDRVVELRDRGDRAINETYAAVRRNGNSHNKIIAGARNTLNARWNEAVDLASRWADAAQRAAEMAGRLQAGAWRAAPLHKLRTRLAVVRDSALAALTSELPALVEPEGNSGDTEFHAACHVAADLFADTFAICNGRAPTGEEAPVAHVEHAELLATDLLLRPRTLMPDEGLTADALAALTTIAAVPAVADTDMYTHRAARGDHDLTVTLIAGVRAGDPRGAQALDRRRTSDVADDATALAAEVRQITTEIDTQRMAGGLEDGPWSSLSSRALALAEATRTDFGRIRVEVGRIRVELSEHRAGKIEQTAARITARAADSAAVADAADRLLELARSGQIASAEEYLEQVSSSAGALPTNTIHVDHLRQFFPAVPDLYATHGDLSRQLRDALDGADPTPAVRVLAEAAGTDFIALSDARRTAGIRALRSWNALSQSGSGRPVDLPGTLPPVLAQSGLEFSDLTFERSSGSQGRAQAGRQWIRLTGVTGTGSALVPLFGSAISPDGATLRVLLVRNAPTPATVLEWMNSEAADHTVLALWLGTPLTVADRRAIADAARGRPAPPVLFLDAAVLGYLICQTEPRRSTFAATTLALTAVSPFRDTPGDAPEEMFYGRTEEMAAVLDLSGPSVLYGGRQLGKSALLRAAAARFQASDPARRHAVERTIFTVGSEDTERDPSRLWDVLWPRLAERGIVPRVPPTGELAQAVHEHVLAWLDEDSSRALLVLLDEADAFLDADAAGNRFTQVDWCRRIMLDSRRRVKFVFAGLHRTARFESLPNQPLSHFGRPVSIGPLRPQHAHDLLTQPLAAMGFTFADRLGGPARVLALANNMPALLQLFGRALMAHLTARPVDPDGPPSLITEDDIDAVFSDADLREAFRQKYQLTINLDHRYMVIAYVVAEAAHDHGIDASLTLSELFESCRQAWPAGFAGMATDDFRGLVTECVDLSVLAEDHGRFRVRTPTVLRLLGTEEHVLDVLYTHTEGMSVPSATDAASYRRKLGSVRSPFTERQLGQLFKPDRRVLVVAGSAALGVEKAATALEDAREDAVRRIDVVRRCHTVTADGIRRSVGQLAGNRAMLIAEAGRLSATALRELLTAAHDAVERSDRQVTVVVTAGPHNAAGWVDWPHRLELGRVDAPGLRLWSDEANLPFHDSGSIEQLLATTGGWPLVVARTMTMGRSDRPVATAQRVLEETAQWLAGRGSHELAGHAELTSGVLARAFSSIAALTTGTGENIEMLAELLELDGLDHDQVTPEGFSSLTGVVTALRALGCLVSDAEGRLRAEPVLAAAVRAAAGTQGTGTS